MILDAYSLWKDQSASREDFLDRISKIEGVYVLHFMIKIQGRRNN